MSRTRVIYFLSAIVLIIGCFALNTSYSLFVDNDSTQLVETTVPILSSNLSVQSVELEPGKSYLVKQTVINNGTIDFNYALNMSSDSDLVSFQAVQDAGTLYTGLGNVSANSSKTEYLVINNEDSSIVTINFNLNTNYTTLKNDLTSNIDSNNIVSVNLGLPYQNEIGTLAKTIIDTYAKETNLSTNLNENDYIWEFPLENTFEDSTNKVFKNISGVMYNKEATLSTTTTSMTLNSSKIYDYFTYSTEYDIGDSSGLFTLKNPKKCRYNTSGCISSLVAEGKKVYVVGKTLSTIATSSNTLLKYENLENIYLVTEAPETTTKSVTIKYKTLSTSSYTTDEKRIIASEDDYGISYVYRGNITNNYVNFAGFTWRIVRINGDGSIRIILDGVLKKVKRYGETTVAGSNSGFSNTSGYNAVGYMLGNPGYAKSYDETHQNLNDSAIKTEVDKFYETYIQNSEKGYNYEKYLADTLFCGDKTVSSESPTGGSSSNYTLYSAAERLNSSLAIPTLKCAEGATNTYSRYTSTIDNSTYTKKGVEVNNDLKYPIALITADELVMAGSFPNEENPNLYLNHPLYYDEPLLNGSWITMTPRGNDNSNLATIYHNKNYLIPYSNVTNAGVRPVVNLKTGILLDDGDGTRSNPYTVKLNEEI